MAHIEKGYYKYESEKDYVFHGNNVYGPGFTLIEGQQESYDLPVDGWQFFNTPQEACIFYGIDIENYDYLTEDPDEEHGHEEPIDVV